jgi:precorrin-2/cobalt-factor-2 C20-methyltransferase
MAKFYGIGVGPGNPKLLTIRAAEVLKELDVLLVPATKKGKKGIAHQIASPYLKEDLVIETIDFPMVVDEEVFNQAGRLAADKVIARIAEGKNVGFITLGDASVYSTYHYIVTALNERVEIETIPGITSFCAAAALDNRPLIEKDEIFSVIPMNASDERIDKILSHGDAFLFMKVYKREERLKKLLEKHGLVKNGMMALRCGFPEARIEDDVIDCLGDNKEYLSVVHTRK